MVSIVLELLSDKNPNIRTLVNAILDYVQIHDDAWKQEIKAKRFQVHNQLYVQAMDEFDSKYPLPIAEQDMYDMYFYDEAQR
jgi:phosphoribosylanthranilate isomerase